MSRRLAVSLSPAGEAAASNFEDRRRQRMTGLLDAIPADRRAEVIGALGLLAEAAHDSA